MRRTTARTLVIVLGIVIIAGCQPSATATPVPAPTPTPTPAPTPSPPTPTSPAATEIRASRENLDAGRYTRRGFVPRVTVAVDGSWRAVQVLAGFFDVQQDVGSPDVITVQFARPDGIYQDAGELVAPSSARTAVDAVLANTTLEVIEQDTSLMGGLEGLLVVVETRPTATADAQVMHVPPGPLLISPGRRLWIAFFDTPEGLLAIMVGGSVARWSEALLAAEPVLESVTIGL
jgi:hypothetical protein